MSQKTLTVLAAAAAAAAVPLGAGSAAEAAVIAEYTIETTTPPDATNVATYGPFNADSGTGTYRGVHAKAATDWTTPAGNGSANSFSANEWSDGDFFEFQVSTVGLEDVTVSWDQTRSSTGPATFDFQYSTDGINFTTALNDYTVLQNTTVAPENATAGNPARSAWSSSVERQSAYTFNVDLSGVTALDNDASVFFRLTDDTNVTSAAGGTNRFDNFVVSANPVPEPSALGLLAVGGAFALRRRRRQ